jgi:hypothetical protein
MSLTDFKAKMNRSKINKYKINNDNKTNTKHEFNVKYERYKQDISKDTLQMQKKSEKTHIFAKIFLHIMPSLLPHVLCIFCRVSLYTVTVNTGHIVKPPVWEGHCCHNLYTDTHSFCSLNLKLG